MTPSGPHPGTSPRDASVLVCTYRAETELELVLAGLLRQSRAPDEVLVADDGSGPETAVLVARFAEAAPFPIIHVRHEDDGCRRSRIVNRAVATSRGEHLAFLDGDTVPHRDWLADHLRRASGAVLCGRRVRLGPDYTPRFTRARLESGDFDGLPPSDLIASALRGDTKRLGFGLRLPRALQLLLHPRRDKKLMGCNFSLPRAAFVEVNGFDEAWAGSALLSDDWDLEVRLRKAGWRLEPLLRAGVTYHLHHPVRAYTPGERELRAARAVEAPLRAVAGLDAHLADLESAVAASSAREPAATDAR